MRFDDRTTKSKEDKVQKYVSLFENNQFHIDSNQFVSARLIKNANLYVIGSNWGLSVIVILQQTEKTANTKQENN